MKGLNMKKYNIIYADPPWEYRVWSQKGKGRSAEGWDCIGNEIYGRDIREVLK
jgi:hypothetical protein